MGTNVVLKSKNLSQIERAFHDAKAAGLPCVLITDEGHIMPPHFDGSPIITALGIGPALRHDAHPITKKFNCLK
jgi:peptidyl-tRNA hydrolase